MAGTTFLIRNIPKDEDDGVLQDFLEGTLNTKVTNLESRGQTALVTLDGEIGLKQIKDCLKEEEEDFSGTNGPLEILDPGYCDDRIVMKELDEEFLSLEFLQYYIESEFADGESVVSSGAFIPNHGKAVVVTFNKKNVIERILTDEDHKPLRSEEYHIQVKPFYSKFYTAQSGNDPSLQGTRETIKKEQSGDKTNQECLSEPASYPNDIFLDVYVPKQPSEEIDSSFVVNEEKVEEEEITLSMPTSKWKLLEDKLKAITECKVNYTSDSQCLNILGKNVRSSKYYNDIIELLKGIKTKSLELNEAERKLLRRDEVIELLENMCVQELHCTSFEINEDSLIIYSADSIDDISEQVTDRFLHRKVIPLPAGVPDAKIRELSNFCNSYFLATVTCNYPPKELIVTGVLEDVSMAKKHLENKLKDYNWLNKDFTLKGKEAIFVKKYEMKSLETLFRNADITKRGSDSDEDIMFEYRCQKAHARQLNDDLKRFCENIIKSEVDLNQFGKEDLALICRNLQANPDLLNNFEKDNSCCVFVEGNEGKEFFDVVVKGPQLDVSPQAAQTKQPSLNYDETKSFSFSSSCKLQILPYGNIINEKTDLLVCGVDASLNMNKAIVSRAFLKLDSNLQDQIKTYNFSSNGVYIDQRSFPGLNCKAVAFITFKVWQQGVSDKSLSAAITEVLDFVNTNGLSSVSFPPLGCGRAFKFPEYDTAQTFINAFHSFDGANVGGNNLKLIRLLAKNRNLFTEVIKAVNSISTMKGDDDRGNESDNEDEDDALQASGSDEKEMQMAALTLDKEALCITIVNSRNDDISSKFKAAIKDHWLFEECFKPDKNFCWPPQFMIDTVGIAKTKGVWVSKSQDPSTHQYFCIIKGMKKDVYEIKDQMLAFYMNTALTKKQLFSPDAPKRGTLEFIKHASMSDDCLPSYWKSGSLKRSENQPNYQLVDVCAKTFKAIEKLVVNTWEQNRVGFGNDARNIPRNSQVKVIKVQRLENPTLFQKYSMKRKLISGEMCQRNRLCQDVGQLPNSKGPVQVMQVLSDFMKKELLHEINEYYLFHGTKEKIVKAICKQGMDSRLASSGGLFGQGVYTAEGSTKADQYADDRDNRLPNGSNLKMFLTRVTMGDVFVCDENHDSINGGPNSQKLRRPPCLECSMDVCGCGADFHHSVLGDGKWIFREFVVYDKEQCYPEYLITYQRV